MDGMKEKLTDFIRQYRYVILVVALGLLLMMLPEGETEEEPVTIETTVHETVDTQTELARILAQIQGVGKVQVMLTVSAGEQMLYEYNEDRSDSADTTSVRRESVIITDADRNESALVQQVIPPVYQGAIIVCQGGDQPSVRLAIVEAVSDVTGLTADKITVLKMK